MLKIAGLPEPSKHKPSDTMPFLFLDLLYEITLSRTINSGIMYAKEVRMKNFKRIKNVLPLSLFVVLVCCGDESNNGVEPKEEQPQTFESSSSYQRSSSSRIYSSSAAKSSSSFSAKIENSSSSSTSKSSSSMKRASSKEEYYASYDDTTYYTYVCGSGTYQIKGRNCLSNALCQKDSSATGNQTCISQDPSCAVQGNYFSSSCCLKWGKTYKYSYSIRISNNFCEYEQQRSSSSSTNSDIVVTSSSMSSSSIICDTVSYPDLVSYDIFVFVGNQFFDSSEVFSGIKFLSYGDSALDNAVRALENYGYTISKELAKLNPQLPTYRVMSNGDYKKYPRYEGNDGLYYDESKSGYTECSDTGYAILNVDCDYFSYEDYKYLRDHAYSDGYGLYISYINKSDLKSKKGYAAVSEDSSHTYVVVSRISYKDEIKCR